MRKGKGALYLFRISIKGRRRKIKKREASETGRKTTNFYWVRFLFHDGTLFECFPSPTSVLIFCALHKSFMILSWYLIVLDGYEKKNFSLISVVINKMFFKRGTEKKSFSRLCSYPEKWKEGEKKRTREKAWRGKFVSISSSILPNINRKQGFVISASGKRWQSF